MTYVFHLLLIIVLKNHSLFNVFSELLPNLYHLSILQLTLYILILEKKRIKFVILRNLYLDYHIYKPMIYNFC